MGRVLLLVGFAVIVLTQASQRGLIEGVVIDWPAYLFGAAAMVVGLFANRKPAEDAPRETILRESGRRADELEADLAHMEAMRRQWPLRGGSDGGDNSGN